MKTTTAAICRTARNGMPPAEQYVRGSERARQFWLEQRSRFAVLRDMSLEANDLGTAKVAVLALRATDPWRGPEDRQVPLSQEQLVAVEKCIRRCSGLSWSRLSRRFRRVMLPYVWRRNSSMAAELRAARARTVKR